jgi:hypothetical protein
MTTEKCQFDFADDLEVYPEMWIEVDGFTPGRPGNGNGLDPCNDYEAWDYESKKIILKVNGTEIELPEETAARVLAAISERFEASMDDLAAAVIQDAAIRAADEKAADRMHDAAEKRFRDDIDDILFMKRGA